MYKYYSEQGNLLRHYKTKSVTSGRKEIMLLNTKTSGEEEVKKNYLPKEEERGGEKLHKQCTRGEPGLEPRTYCVLDESQ